MRDERHIVLLFTCGTVTEFMMYIYITVELILWDIRIQETPPFRGHKIWCPKNVHIIFVFVSSIEGTPLFMGKGLFFDSGSQNPDSTSVQGTP